MIRLDCMGDFIAISAMLDKNTAFALFIHNLWMDCKARNNALRIMME